MLLEHKSNFVAISNTTYQLQGETSALSQLNQELTTYLQLHNKLYVPPENRTEDDQSFGFIKGDLKLQITVEGRRDSKADWQIISQTTTPLVRTLVCSRVCLSNLLFNFARLTSCAHRLPCPIWTTLDLPISAFLSPWTILTCCCKTIWLHQQQLFDSKPIRMIIPSFPLVGVMPCWLLRCHLQLPLWASCWFAKIVEIGMVNNSGCSFWVLSWSFTIVWKLLL